MGSTIMGGKPEKEYGSKIRQNLNQASQKINIIIQIYFKIRRNITVKTTVIGSSIDELVMES